MFRLSLVRTAPLCLAAALLAAACSKDSSTPTTPTPAPITTYGVDSSWTCASGINCQDVYDVALTAGASITVKTSNVGGSSASQIALYAPGTALGGTNLLTGTGNEYRCTVVNDCDKYTAGESKTVTVSQTGTYRIAVTRDWGVSCGGSGTYRLDVTSSLALQTGTQTANDQKSAAAGSECK